MVTWIRQGYDIVKTTIIDFVADDCTSMAAALAYYTMFSLPPLLVVVIAIAGMFYDRGAVREAAIRQMEAMLGPQAAEQIETVVEHTRATGSGALATVLGVAILIVGARSVLAQLQYALNKAWDVKPDPKRNGWKRVIIKPILSLAMILAIAFLLLVSMAISASLSAFGGVLGEQFPHRYTVPLLHTSHFLVSLVVIMFLFAAMFKILPDAKIPWRDVWTGAFVTALLFSVGKFLIGIYLGNTNVGTAYGAAGAMAILLIWIYYASLIVLLGAEFTQVWAHRQSPRRHSEP